MGNPRPSAVLLVAAVFGCQSLAPSAARAIVEDASTETLLMRASSGYDPGRMWPGFAAAGSEGTTTADGTRLPTTTLTSPGGIPSLSGGDLAGVSTASSVPASLGANAASLLAGDSGASGSSSSSSPSSVLSSLLGMIGAYAILNSLPQLLSALPQMFSQLLGSIGSLADSLFSLPGNLGQALSGYGGLLGGLGSLLQTSGDITGLAPTPSPASQPPSATAAVPSYDPTAPSTDPMSSSPSQPVATTQTGTPPAESQSKVSPGTPQLTSADQRQIALQHAKELEAQLLAGTSPSSPSVPTGTGNLSFAQTNAPSAPPPASGVVPSQPSSSNDMLRKYNGLSPDVKADYDKYYSILSERSQAELDLAYTRRMASPPAGEITRLENKVSGLWDNAQQVYAGTQDRLWKSGATMSQDAHDLFQAGYSAKPASPGPAPSTSSMPLRIGPGTSGVQSGTK